MKIDYKKMRKLGEQNLPYGQIADEMHVSLEVVIDYLEGLKVNSPKKIPDESRTEKYADSFLERRKKVKKYFLDDMMSADEIAEKLKISKKLVLEHMDMMGLSEDYRKQVSEKVPESAENENESSITRGANSTEDADKSVSPEITIQPKEFEESAESMGNRRNQIMILIYEQGIEPEKIYEIFSDIPHDVIERDIRYVERHENAGLAMSLRSSHVQTRSKKYERNSGFDTPEDQQAVSEQTASEQTTVSEQTANKQAEAKEVESAGKSSQENNVSSEERRNEVAELIRTTELDHKGIAKQLGVSVDIVNGDIKYLSRNGIITKEEINTWKRRRRIGKETADTIDIRRRKIEELVKNTNLTRNEIAEQLGIKPPIVNSDIKWLIIHGKILQEDLQKNRAYIDRRNKIAELIRTTNLTRNEIIEQLGINPQMLNNDIKWLKKHGILKAKEIDEWRSRRKQQGKRENSEITERRSRVAEMVRTTDLSPKEIAQQLEVVYFTINNDIQWLKKHGILTAEEINEWKNRRKQSKEVQQPEAVIEPTKEVEQSEVVVQEPSEEVEQSEVVVQEPSEEVEQSEVVVQEPSEEVEQPEEVQPQEADKQNQDNGLKRGLAEKKYIVMMGQKIKEKAKKGEFESAIQYLESLLKEIPFTEAENEQFMGIMRVLQRERIKGIQKRYFNTGSTSIGDEGER